MSIKYSVADIPLLESDINIALNLVEHLYYHICDSAPTFEFENNKEAYHIKEKLWSSQADYIQAMTRGVLSILEEAKKNIHSVVEDFDRKEEDKRKECQTTQ